MERDRQRVAPRVMQGEEGKDDAWERKSNGGRQIERKDKVCVQYASERT